MSIPSLEEAKENLAASAAVPCTTSITLRQAGVEVAVSGTDTELVRATFLVLYEEFKSLAGYKEGPAPKEDKGDSKSATHERIARAMAIKAAVAKREGR